MSKSLFNQAILAALFVVAIFTSCGKNEEVDLCDAVVCSNGNCSEGICTCDHPYEGTNCDVLYREKFLGTWVGSAVCASSGNSSYSIVIAPASNVGLVTITNLKNTGLTVFGTTGGSNSIVADQQALGSITVTATVGLEDGLISIKTYEGSGDYCTFTGIKQ